MSLSSAALAPRPPGAPPPPPPKLVMGEGSASAVSAVLYLARPESGASVRGVGECRKRQGRALRDGQLNRHAWDAGLLWPCSFPAPPPFIPPRPHPPKSPSFTMPWLSMKVLAGCAKGRSGSRVSRAYPTLTGKPPARFAWSCSLHAAYIQPCTTDPEGTRISPHPPPPAHLEVAMDDALSVDVGQPRQDLAQDGPAGAAAERLW